MALLLGHSIQRRSWIFALACQTHHCTNTDCCYRVPHCFGWGYPIADWEGVGAKPHHLRVTERQTRDRGINKSE